MRRAAEGRTIRHELTAAGAALLAECDAIVGALDAQEYADFSEVELRACGEFLQRVLAAVD